MDEVRHSLRIVHVVRQFRPGVGGLENFVEQLAYHQIQAGHRVTVCTLDRIFGSPDPRPLPAQEKFAGLDVRRIRFFGSQRYPIAPAVLEHLRGADVVHVHALDFFCDFLAATKWLHRRPLVLTTHGGFFHTGFAQRLKRIYLHTVTRAALTRYAAVATCSANDTQQFRIVKPKGLVEIPNAVDVAKFEGLSDPRTYSVLYFGRLAPNKGLPQLIDWFRGLWELDGRWTLTLAGKPMGVSLDEIQRYIAAAGLENVVTVRVSPTDAELASLIGRSSVYACASVYEGFGLAAVEAASAGLYPVLNRIPPFEETVSRLGFGQLVDFASPHTYASTYSTLLEALEHFRKSWTRNDVRKVVSSYGWEHACVKYEKLYLSAIGRAGRRIGEIDISVLSERDALALLALSVESRRSMFVTFANAHTVNLASRDSRLRDILKRATVLNDGVGADWASRLLYGSGFPENLNGTDLLPKVLSRLAEGTPIFLLGTTDQTVRRAADALRQRHPQLRVAGYRSGYFSHDEEDAVGEVIRASGARVVLVGMGQPRQELWAERNFEKLGVVAICVGAFLDFAAGAVPRAPLVWRRLRLEWVFRLLQEPRRLAARYVLGNASFLARVAKQFLVGYRV